MLDTTAALDVAATPHLRPAAHFTAAATWLNDPNGLLYHHGVYHLFFQNNPEANTWGNISWGHATSPDLVNWTEQPVAIPCTAEESIFSGSAVADVNNTAGFAPPGQSALVAIYTSAYTKTSARPGIQAQSLAYSLDEGATWTRYAGNPVLDTDSKDFRDPKVFWYGGEDGHWVMVLVEAADRRVAIYTSPNLREWTLASRFGPAHAVEGVWECPDLFPLRLRGTDEIRWVLVVSLYPGGIAGGSGAQYFIGSFDGTTFTPEHLSTSDDASTYQWLDYGHDYYAAVSFNDVPDGRRLMIGWASNWDYATEIPTSPWRSAMSLVREIDLVPTPDGPRLTQTPILPTDNSVDVFDLSLDTTPGTRTEITLHTGDPALPDRVVLLADGDTRTLTCDRTHSGRTDFHPTFPAIDTAPLPPGDTTTITIVSDASILETYIGEGAAVLTQQVFPHAPLRHLRVRTIPTAAKG
ncbi:MAG: glycoside hydrolase family 32 protein [Actinobacteria bacterium]|nr:glycoside hydrolase family 32 protein [Actinomycetota bacterium]